MSDGNDGQQLSLAEGLQPFRGRGWQSQVAVVAGGFLAWTAAYAAVLALLGGDGLATAETAAAVRSRRRAAAVAGAAAGLYFAALWARAHGGPILNVLYLVGTQAFVPGRVYALGGAAPEHAVTTAGTAFGLSAVDPVWVVHHLIAVGPSFVAFGVALTYWGASLTPAEEEAFATNHLPEAWLRLRDTE